MKNSRPENDPLITEVVPLPQKRLRITLRTGSELVLNMHNQLNTNRFYPLKDDAVFSSVTTDGLYRHFDVKRNYAPDKIEGYMINSHTPVLVELVSDVMMASYTVSVTGGAGSGSYHSGKTVTVKADAVPGHTFLYWTADGIELQDPKQQTVTFTIPSGFGKATVLEFFSDRGFRNQPHGMFSILRAMNLCISGSRSAGASQERTRSAGSVCDPQAR